MKQPNRIDSQPAFLLSATPWRETSLLAELFSRDYGRVAVVARSARKRQSELRGVLVPFVPVQVAWYGREELKTLHRAEWLGGWPQPQGRALFGGLYVNELVQKLTAREDPQPALYEALRQVMRALCTEPNHTAALRRFEWALLTLSGYAPDLRHDGDGNPVEVGRQYWLRPEHAVLPLEQRRALPPHEIQAGVAVGGEVLMQLHSGEFADAAALQQARQITRLLLDFRLPEGIKSRQVLQQIQAFR
ncbi:DNA repair protein RecO [Eikenella sp. S3360]|uniref:DNA repair protein RecO n=1 Tax=Eikenella glucosivorans TaxID=2766967 RepID=A0ABS0NCM6_9NEIS|nr:DNA repair protein RecO [Eikenella glucosivorans]MBH5330019.1 DNA repair protein RecO [Eikenella glucosivorans]